MSSAPSVLPYATQLSERRLAIQRRVSDLINRARARGVHDPDILDEVIPEGSLLLETSVEELRVAEEELRVQNEEILATRSALERERAHYRSLFDSAPVAYVVTDLMGTIQEANQTAATLLHRRREYLINKPLTVFVAPPERRIFRGALDRIRSSAEPQELPILLQSPSGDFEARATVAPQRGEGGRVTGLSWILREESARLEADLL